jgi:hypothetical protein
MIRRSSAYLSKKNKDDLFKNQRSSVTVACKIIFHKVEIVVRRDKSADWIQGEHAVYEK